MGRMPVALFLAFLASLGLHAAALFGPEIDLAPEPEAPALVAELRPAPEPPKVQPPAPSPREAEPRPAPHKAEPAARTPSASRPAAPRQPRILAVPAAPESSAPTVQAPVESPPPVPDGASAAGPAAPDAARSGSPAAPDTAAAGPSEQRLPPRGSIRFRVDRGDSGFEIGVARQEWELDGDRYRLSSSAETTGLAWLLRSVSLEMESVGRVTARGLRPDAFGVLRDGRRGRERALFDWEAMRLRIGDRSEHALEPGTQDLLSVFYQLGFSDLAPGGTAALPLATGKKYAVFRVEYLGDEDIEIPLGALRARHLRLPGETTTEIWLAYDYRLLPVKIRHIDNKGGVYVQSATQILLEQ